MIQALIALSAVGVLAVALQTYRLALVQRDLEAAHKTHAEHLQADAQALAAAQERARAEEQRRRREHEQIAQQTAERIRQAQADAARAAAAAGRLRTHVATLAAACGASADPAVAGSSETAAGPGLLLADLFSRADDRAGELARFADSAHAAGVACERAYEALRR